MDDTRDNHVPARSSALPVAPPIIAPSGFKPICPGCRYDLSGSPDGPCPECGEPFSHQGLISAELARQENRSEPHVLLVIALAIGLAPCFWVPEAGMQSLVLIIMWGLVGVWMYKCSTLLLQTAPVLSLWLIIPVLRTGAVFLALPVPLLTASVTLTLVLAIIIYSYRRQPIPTVRTLAIVLCAPLLLLGGALVYYSLAGLGAGRHWSEFDYPFWGHINYPWNPQRALPYTTLLYLGITFILLALVPAIPALVLLKRLRSNQTRQTARD